MGAIEYSKSMFLFVAFYHYCHFPRSQFLLFGWGKHFQGVRCVCTYWIRLQGMVFWVFYLLVMCICFMQKKLGKKWLKQWKPQKRLNLEQGKVTPFPLFGRRFWKWQWLELKAEAFGFTEGRVIYEQASPILLRWRNQENEKWCIFIFIIGFKVF